MSCICSSPHRHSIISVAHPIDTASYLSRPESSAKRSWELQTSHYYTFQCKGGFLFYFSFNYLSILLCSMSIYSSVTTWSPAVQSNMSICFNTFRCSNNDFMQSYNYCCNRTTFVTVKLADRRIRIRRHLAITVKYIVRHLLTITVIGIRVSS